MDENKHKIRVIGWTDMNDSDFPFAESVSDEAFDAIVAEVREHGYLFGGDAHQERRGCCPVLSDGTKAYFSWRGWGYLIAVAYDCKTAKGGYDHMCGYMDSMIKPSALKYPEGIINYSLLDVECNEYDFTMPKTQEIFAYRRFDLRPATELALKVKPFDIVNLDFTVVGIAEGETEAREHICERKYRVTRIFGGKNFEELFAKLKEQFYFSVANCCGYDASDDENAAKYKTKRKLFGGETVELYEYSDEDVIERLYADYGRDEVERCGALCFVLGEIERSGD